MLTGELLRAVTLAADHPEPEAQAMARLCLLDWLGVTIAGAREPVVEHLVADAKATGGFGEHRLIGRPERVSLRDAALINGAAGHALDFDDGLAAMMGHPSAAILPALLALAAARECTGAALLDAIVAAVEAAGRIGGFAAAQHYRRGFHATGTIGAMAAAIGCARLLGFETERMLAATGLAVTRAAGLKISFGTDAKPLHAGWAALVGLTSACWAEQGITAASDALPGFAAAMSASPDATAATAAGAAHILNVRFKRHAACGVTHPAIDAARRLAARHAPSRDAIASVTIRIDRQADTICNIAEPRSGLEAKFSLRTVVAMVLLGLDCTSPASFSDRAISAPPLAELRDKVRVDLQSGWPITVSEVELEMRDGSRYGERSDGAERAADLSALTVELEAKFRVLASPILGSGQTGQLSAALAEIGAADRLGALLTMTVPLPARPIVQAV